MKKILALLLISVIFFACEKDDFCIKNPVTPNLVLRFYNNTNKEALKKVSNLYVWAEGKDTIFNNVNSDSIYIPLNSIDTTTIYKFAKGTNVATFTIKYTPKEEYVSRSCGFRVVFNDVSFETNNNWILDYTPLKLTTINNENAAHVKIFH